MLPVEVWEASCTCITPVHSLLVDRKYQTGQSRDNHIIVLFNFKCKRRCINVICLQNHNINAMS